jgi:hypothetical protein
MASLNCSSTRVYKVTILEVCDIFSEDAMPEYSDIKLQLSKFRCHLEMSDVWTINKGLMQAFHFILTHG